MNNGRPSSSTTLNFEQLASPLFPLVKQFYKQARYHNHVGKTDEVYVVRQTPNNKIVAAVRLVNLPDYLMLRSMVVSPELQREGIGHFLLQHLKSAIGTRVCWSFPFEWLTSFYGLIEFNTCQPEQCPPDIKQKYFQYTEQGRKLVIMKYHQP